MRWFSSAATFFQRVEHYSRPRTYQFIALFFLFPCFYTSDFFSKMAYFLNHRRLLRISRQCTVLGGQDSALQLDHFSLNIRERFKLKESLGNITGELEAGNRALEGG